jgi:hypothetical protein
MNAQPIINDKIPNDDVIKIQVPQSNGLEQMNIRIFIILLLIYIFSLCKLLQRYGNSYTSE